MPSPTDGSHQLPIPTDKLVVGEVLPPRMPCGPALAYQGSPVLPRFAFHSGANLATSAVLPANIDVAPIAAQSPAFRNAGFANRTTNKLCEFFNKPVYLRMAPKHMALHLLNGSGGIFVLLRRASHALLDLLHPNLAAPPELSWASA